MPRPYSRSPSPRQEDRRRSRSPRRRDDGDGDRDRDRPRRRDGGFRWKQKRPTDDDRRADEQRGLERGHRDTERGKERERERVRDGERTRSPTRDRRGDRYRDFAGTGDRRRHDGNSSYNDNRYRATDTTTAPTSSTRDRREEQERKEKKKEKKEKDKKAAAVVAPGEPMIIVNVNDRLGTKAAIPCLASDPIRLFKAQVAARIGREPHEILLKRQGERPFKDQLTLEDYGVGNGVQLDL
ncbi:ubiquitin-like protein 5 [Blastomyces parvus]|uniref:Ubiquitin-like modifier HUB1 n=1 Tax=Blastomyces parvus TaxID=2060905 RepID=A0A2B7XEV3_9EURO|nr:ubiquitin-like protein 5 [Blastomyces parvus]